MKPTEHAALAERLEAFVQVPSADSLADFPPYIDSFLAHLRLLVGVPFQYVVVDQRLLPDESIRFFYLDRSWTDRLVDGALAVGKVGTRELAHVQAHAQAVQTLVDDSESLVRRLQKGAITDYAATKNDASRPRVEADVVTGFLLRSALVSGWPHLEVRAWLGAARLTTLRLERLSPGVLIALFRGVPDKVELEEPHHGVQFGVKRGPRGITMNLRDEGGHEIKHTIGGVARPVPVNVPMRPGGHGVMHVTALRRALHVAQRTETTAISQTGSAAFALSSLDPPYRQPFSSEGGARGGRVPVATRVQDAVLENTLREWVGP